MAGRSNWGKKKAKQFPRGKFTATQTGARQEAKRHAEEQAGVANAKRVMKSAQSQKDFEDLVGGK